MWVRHRNNHVFATGGGFKHLQSLLDYDISAELGYYFKKAQ